MEGEAQQPSAPVNHGPTSFPLASHSPSGPSSDVPVVQCHTWEDVRQLLLSCDVPYAQLPCWEVLWWWDQLKVLVASEAVDNTTFDQLLTCWYQRVEGTRDSYQCLAPEQEGRKGSWCLKVVGRRDRMRSHICSDHLGVREFQCTGQCGQVEWQTFLQRRYLQQHVHPEIVSCPQCAKVIYKRNLSTHHC